jgi:hypothetical protein
LRHSPSRLLHIRRRTSARVPADAVLVGVVQAPDCDPSISEAEQQFGLTGDSRVIVTCEPAKTHVGSDPQPNLTIGLGWYIYIYLNRGDWLYLAGLGYTAAAAALCAWLTPTIAGAVACAVAAYIIGNYVIKRTAPPRGYCAEFKFNYWGTFAGYKLVQRSC